MDKTHSFKKALDELVKPTDSWTTQQILDAVAEDSDEVDEMIEGYLGRGVDKAKDEEEADRNRALAQLITGHRK